MKKTACAVIACLMLLALAGCGADSASKSGGGGEPVPSAAGKTQTAPQPEGSGERMPPAFSSEAESSAEPKSAVEKARPADLAASPKGAIDIDLTLLSSTMVYAEVSNIMFSPEDYIGKTVKMQGQFACIQGLDGNGQPVPGQLYFACIISDATACCAQGLEFVLAGEHTYPDDYPKPGADITVSGVFDTYEEDGILYCQLTHAELAA